MNSTQESSPPIVAQADRAFPMLSPQQIARIAARGRRRSTARGELLVEAGDPVIPFFVILSGAILALRTAERGETVIASHAAGQFTGEASLISGRPALARLRVSEPGEVIQLDRETLLSLIQTDAELSEVPFYGWLGTKVVWIN
jgi:thioredoxin reductase (NADPH)